MPDDVTATRQAEHWLALTSAICGRTRMRWKTPC